MYKANVTNDFDNITDYDNITFTNCTKTENDDNNIFLKILTSINTKQSIIISFNIPHGIYFNQSFIQ